MKVKINEHEFELRYSMRMFINYEAIMGKSLDPADLQNYTNFIALLFACISASAAYNKIQLNLSYDDFLNWLDEQGGELFLVKFGQWYLKASQANAALMQQSSSEEGTKKSRKKS